MLTTTDPRSGVSAATDLEPTTDEGVDEIARWAAAAAHELQARGREFRAQLLDAMAAAVLEARDELVAVADSETGLGVARLTGEAGRSAFQFQLFAEAVREGSFVEAAIDHAGDTPLGPGPDVRRMLVSIGPVAVFGSSNFPFAFSVLGGDTASAIAAGSPVVVKAHGSHPLTSKLSFEVLQRAAAAVGAPRGTFGIVYGQRAGVALVKHPSIKAAGFTGSLGAASALQAAIDERPDPIPFFGELSSINPLVITPGAAAARTSEIASGLFTSFTGSAGQLCTKPGIAFVPSGETGDALVEQLKGLTREAGAQVLLNDRIRDSFGEISARLEAGGAPVAAQGSAEVPSGAGSADGFFVPPTLLETTAGALDETLAEECFGPLVVVARYTELEEVQEAFGRIPKSLTATLHVEDDESDLVSSLAPTLEASAGRIVFNGFPTGVRVTWAQQHGGPWPSTNSQHTSVGVTAVRRFLRPLAWQNAPQSALPVELRDADPGIPRRIDGVLVLPA
ncbi:aldehyde dehydrogenase (NADP(+)) [Herbiconiux sp. KACC 21604]|uniref:aldehyde dehydrogenase (NADP(+)) n=1 Tax=unclassified Herbiconiux TaxID=2618217 RepID=UPI00149278C5|nr:aldehyde dehydrogenase (NADP(+)) [Herbiconiux sp. SALV-R1]QJU55065.1 aldehyde dehydrogenase (NADP(+)) [Herbiconiux sp. SALV-R1]WPO86206.1 aldehyde dehydrogenase (NADP(+)) [Herbiconiux sp. KACC 21604]